MLKQFCFRICNFLKKFEAWILHHLDRSQNEEAHEVAQGMIADVFVMKADVPLYRGQDALLQEVHYLKTGEIPKEIETKKRYAFVCRSHKYVMLGDVLFMKGADLVLRRVPWKEEIYMILEENHEGACGGHFALKITLHKILQAGYVWPSIQRDVYLWCKSCDRC